MGEHDQRREQQAASRGGAVDAHAGDGKTGAHGTAANAAVGRMAQAPAEKHVHKAGDTVKPAPSVMDHGEAGKRAIVMSNNPEGVSSPGVLLADMAVDAGELAVYVHHSNLTGKPLDFYMQVTPDEKGAKLDDDGWDAEGATPGTTEADANYKVAKAVADEPALDGGHAGKSKRLPPGTHERHTRGEVPTGPIHLGTIEPRGEQPLLDTRHQLRLGSAAKVTIFCVEPGQAKDPAKLPLACGNAKIATTGTNGRAAGVYTGATWNDEQTFLVKDLSATDKSKWIRYWITSTNRQQPETPIHHALQQKPSQPLDPRHLVQWISNEPNDDLVVTKIARECWQLDEKWLADDAHWLRGGHLEKDWDTGKKDDKGKEIVKSMSSDYVAMTVGMRDAVRAVRAELAPLLADKKGKDAEKAKQAAAALARFDGGAVKDYVAQYKSIGAANDTANYGTEYELTFHLANDGAEAKAVELLLENHGGVYRGSMNVTGSDEDGDVALGVKVGEAHIARVQVDGGSAESPKTRTVKLHFMSPGQISAGQAILFKG